MFKDRVRDIRQLTFGHAVNVFTKLEAAKILKSAISMSFISFRLKMWARFSFSINLYISV